MDIKKMHEVFRTLGQQKGMQLVRAILPEEIDVYLNDAIAEKTRAEIRKGIDYAVKSGDSLMTSKMSNINLFKSLYRNARFKIDDTLEEGIVKQYNKDTGYYEITIPTVDCTLCNNNILKEKEYFINPMMYLGFSVEYDEISKGNSKSCRLVGLDDVFTVLKDYCSRPDKDNPIAVVLGDPYLDLLYEANDNIYDDNLQIYIGKPNTKIKYLNINYIKKPNVVDYEYEINCDLSEYAHYEIVEIAVQKFFRSIGVNQGN